MLPIKSVFVSGTGTDVGKTLVSAGLMSLLRDQPSYYWKPIQTGTLIGRDLDEVSHLGQVSSDRILKSTYEFPEPVAPSVAAKKWNKTIQTDVILNDWLKIQNKSAPESCFVIEGAGGVLVPLNHHVLMLELIKQFKLPVLIVAADELGSMNHTLMTLKVCQQYKVDVVGVVLSGARESENLQNKEAIEQFSHVQVLAQLNYRQDKRDVALEVSRNQRLKNLFGLS